MVYIYISKRHELAKWIYNPTDVTGKAHVFFLFAFTIQFQIIAHGIVKSSSDSGPWIVAV